MKLRIRFAKTGKVRWTSHRDLARMWERALRRIKAPLAYSEGFRPRPRVSFGLALPTGLESVAEYLDLTLADPGADDLADLEVRLSAALPVGVDVSGCVSLPAGEASLQDQVTSCTWRIEVLGTAPGDLDDLGRVALGAPALPITRERKARQVTDDLRPALLRLEVLGPTADGAELECELLTQPRGVRPAELLAVLGGGAAVLEAGRACRMHQWIERDGARFEPEAAGLPLGATGAPHAQARAS